MECLNGVVNLSLNGCDCISLDSGSDPASLSGLYVDDTTAGRIPLKEALFDCSDPSAVELLQRLLSDAITEAYMETFKVTERRLLKTYTAQNGTIGKKKSWTSAMTGTTTDTRYLFLQPKYIRGLKISFQDLSFKLESTGTLQNLTVIDEDGTVIFANLTAFNSGKNTFIDFDKALIFIVQYDQKPLNVIHVPCCNSTPEYSAFMKVGSGNLGSITWPFTGDIPEFEKSDYTQGMILQYTVSCQGFDFLCNLDWKQSYYGIVFAKLIQQIARKNLAYWLLSSDRVSAYTLIKEDELRNIIGYLSQDIQVNLNFLPEAYNFSDCYKCNGIYKGEIII